ncbi:MAG TPA: MotA/TolQ/ExbB proton channel family protein [Polyangiaceae bacterium]|nr:MotA/TolQ/ExbB proton channel family protein [Polyangiaceae bacterium]
MHFDFVRIWSDMSVLSKGIAICLLFMAIASIGVIVERVIAFAKNGSASKAFAVAARPLLEKWEVEKLVVEAKKYKGSPLAGLFERMASKYQEGVKSPGNMTPVELARNEAARHSEAVGAELRRGMSVLASVGSVAPFVGLLGTVVGIIAAFASIGNAGSAGMSAVMSGISEALFETAFGLMVAIPAVLFYNYLSTRVASIELALSRSVGELLDEMENNHGRDAGHRIEKAA